MTASDERGSATVEAAIVVPALMVVILVAVQLALWALAQQAVQDVASNAVTAAAGVGATAATGTASGQQDLRVVAGALVDDASVDVGPDGPDEVQALVAGWAPSILPWWRPPVRAVRVATVQRFRPGP